MKKFKIEVIRTDEFEVEIDETVWDKEALKDWSSVFWTVESAEELAHSVAEAVSRNGSQSNFIEGFGNIKTLYRDGAEKTKYRKDENGEWVKDNDYANGITIRIISEDDDYETETID